MELNQVNTENSELFNNFLPALNKLILSIYTDDLDTYNFIVYRQNTQDFAFFAKMNSTLLLNSAVDCFSIDNPAAKFRFTVIYKIQSLQSNIKFNIITKTNDKLALLSLQNIFPAFNWAEREI